MNNQYHESDPRYGMTEEEVKKYREMIDSFCEDLEFDNSYDEAQEKIGHLVEGFLNLSPSLRKLVHESVKYNLEIDNEETYFYNTEVETLLENISSKLKELKPEQLKMKKHIISVEELEIIKNKDIINVEEVEILFSMGSESQKKYRARTYQPLPTISTSKKGVKVLYKREEVEKWNKRYRTI